MENVSQKEKLILYILVLLLLAYGLFMLFVKPAIKSKDLADTKNQSLVVSQENMSNYIANKAQYKKSMDSAQSNLKNSVGKYYDVLTADQIDDVLTAYVLGSSLSPAAMKISIVDTGSISNYNPSASANTVSTTVATTVAGSNSSKTSKSSDLTVANISLSVVGTQSNLMNLLNTLETDSAIYISNYTFNHDSTDDSKSTLTVNLLLFMCGTEH